MDKLKMHTPDIAEENYKKLAALFPDAVTETKDENGNVVRAIDKDVLMQEINAAVVDDKQERYQFTWPDKRKSVILANQPIAKTLRFEQSKSVGKDGTPGGTDSENIYIEGDNLEALKLLQETYLGKVKMIYIDPPYNTGNDFIYEDDFSESAAEYADISGQTDEEGNRLVQNNESNGRFHTDWLNMMYPRLKLAKDLLTDDGVIFISIDDNELDNLKKICDEIFSDEQYINLITVKTKESSGASGGGEDRKLKKNCEYVLVYSRNNFHSFNDVYKKSELSAYLSEMKSEGKSFKYTTVFTNLGTKKYYTTIKDGSNGDMRIYKHSDYSTKSISKIAADEGISELEVFSKYFDYVCTTENAQTSIRTRVKNATDDEDTLYSVEYVPISGRNKGKLTTIYFVGKSKRLVSWFKNVCIREDGKIFKKEKYGTLWTGFNWNNVAREGEIPFPNGKKSLDFIKQIISLATNETDNNIIMDFFSGSATTAHAVMQLNAEDGGNRKFILVQLPEITSDDSEARKAGYNTICDIGEDRIRRAGKKIKEETGADIDYGFRCFKIDSSNMKDVYYRPSEIDQMSLDELTDNIKEDRTPEDLLVQVMLDLGVLLSSKIEATEIAGKKVFNVADGYLIACFDKDVTEETVTAIAKMKPFYSVFRDNSMKDDNVAANFEQIFATYSPQTVRKVL